ncbi:MAG: biotin carboxylase N-terminal domain-containing protein [Sandaracinaceae bacterium]
MSTHATELAQQICNNIFRPESKTPPWAREDASRRLRRPGRGYLGIREVFAVCLGVPSARLADLRSLPHGEVGRRLLALRYFIDNADIWLEHFNWRTSLARLGEEEDEAVDRPAEVEALATRVRAFQADSPKLDPQVLFEEGSPLLDDPSSDSCLGALVALAKDAGLRAELRERLRDSAVQLADRPELLDRLYLASLELDRYPATTVSAGTLEFVIVADKGEMGVRAVREAAALDLVPVVLHSTKDDNKALQVRLARELGGFTIGLKGSFRESYASYAQITERVVAAFQKRFGDEAEAALSRAVLYPGYGPLAENAAAIRHFRRHGIVFCGPMEDVVEHAGDKRRFRAIVESIDAKAVTPGIVIAENAPAAIRERVLEAHTRGDFTFPGRLKAANGGGGRGQAIVEALPELDAAISKVLGEIAANAWDPGVMFEQNIDRTVHLEVQVLRDRYGNARHLGMRDCTEQRASQKVQEEAPPAILQNQPELRRRVQDIAVAIADHVGYVGAGTVELMYAGGEVYFLEMNTRIQVEHPVTEESSAIRRGDSLDPLNLVQWQLRVANGEAIDFRQEDVLETHVARELRINAEVWRPDLKDPRDRQRGLFVPNGGVFDVMDLPDAETLATELADAGVEGLKIRFDVGFEAGDTLINKDPTFGKLIVAVKARGDGEDYERLRLAVLLVLERIRIEGRQMRPDGKVIRGSRFETNLEAHRWILEHPMMQRHTAGESEGRHVGWVVDALRAEAAERAESAG